MRTEVNPGNSPVHNQPSVEQNNVPASAFIPYSASSRPKESELVPTVKILTPLPLLEPSLRHEKPEPTQMRLSLAEIEQMPTPKNGATPQRLTPYGSYVAQVSPHPFVGMSPMNYQPILAYHPYGPPMGCSPVHNFYQIRSPVNAMHGYADFTTAYYGANTVNPASFPTISPRQVMYTAPIETISPLHYVTYTMKK